MASVTLNYVFAGGEAIATNIDFEDSYPDALSRAVTEAMRAHMEHLAYVFAAESSDDE